MKTPDPEACNSVVDDHLFQLEMKVARRADQLSQSDRSVGGRDLEHWLQAEREVFKGGSAPLQLGPS